MDRVGNNDGSTRGEVDNEKPKVLNRNAGFLYALTSNRLHNQLQQIDSLDSKTISLLGFSCTLMAVLAAAIAIIGIRPTVMIMAYVSLALSVLAFVFIVAVSLKSYHTKGSHVGPDIQEAWSNARKYTEPQMLKWAARSFTEAYEHNISSGLIKGKISAVNRDIKALIVQIVFMILAIVLIYFGSVDATPPQSTSSFFLPYGTTSLNLLGSASS